MVPAVQIAEAACSLPIGVTGVVEIGLQRPAADVAGAAPLAGIPGCHVDVALHGSQIDRCVRRRCVPGGSAAAVFEVGELAPMAHVPVAEHARPVSAVGVVSRLNPSLVVVGGQLGGAQLGVLALRTCLVTGGSTVAGAGRVVRVGTGEAGLSGTVRRSGRAVAGKGDLVAVDVPERHVDMGEGGQTGQEQRGQKNETGHEQAAAWIHRVPLFHLIGRFNPCWLLSE